jgi:UDP-glucose 4-epimerase
MRWDHGMSGLENQERKVDNIPMKKILVTGGAGYIGSHAVKLLRQQGALVLVLDNLVYGHPECTLGAELIVGDIGDEKLLAQIFAHHYIEAVMHFSAYCYVGESVTDPAKYYQNNVAGTLSLLKSMVKADIRNFIFSSTCATYGNPLLVPIPEDHSQNPINPYGATKLMVERMLQDFDYAYGLKSIVFRYFNAAGADPGGEIGEWHQPETHLIPLILDAAIGQRDSVKIFGTDYPTPDGTCLRDYIHVNDLADAHIRGLEFLHDQQRSEAFNLGNGVGFSVKEVIQTAERVTGRKIRTMVTDRRPGDPPALIGSAEKAARLLGWKPQFPGIEIITETAWRWHLKLRS